MDSRFLASVAALVAVGRVAVEVRADGAEDVGFERVPALEASVLVAGEGFLAVAVVETPGLVVGFPGDDVRLLGTVEVRRAADVIVDLRLSSSETDG